MKNVKMSVKVGVLVAVLIGTTLTIAFVGVRQLNALNVQFEELVDTTAREMTLAAEARVALLSSIRAEKNAILVGEKPRAAEYADEARAQLTLLKGLRSELASFAAGDLASPRGKALQDLERGIEEFERNQKEVLPLAVTKSNRDAGELLAGDLHERVEAAADFIAGLGAPMAEGSTPLSSSDSLQEAKIAAGQQLIGRFYDVITHLYLHRDAPTENEMARLDAEIRTRLAALQESVRRLSGMLSDAERSRGLSVLASLETLKPQVMKIQELSHVNSDLYAQQRTVTKSVETGNACDAALVSLLKALQDRLDAEKRTATANAVLGRHVVVTTAIVGALISLVLAVATIRSITRPVQHGVEVFEAIAAGDLTRRMALDRRDEIGRLAAASDRMADSLCGVVTQIRSLAGRLGGSAAELSGVSHDLLAQSQEMATQTESVAAATEQTSSNISGMAAAAEQMSVNVSSISSASEEVSVNVGTVSASAEETSRKVGSVSESIAHITASLHDVARDARQGSELTQKARDLASEANQAMRQLDQAASEITKVTEVIKSIALQTNLLALNATIEATSAGEAGKGFAVVAAEVKELAGQSGQSAEDIARRIESVQSGTREAVKVIEGVARLVSDVNVSAARISEAVDVQTRAAGQIASDIAGARSGVSDIARSIAEVAKGANDVSGNTAEVSKAATDVSRNATEAARAAEMISSNIHGVSEATRQNSSSSVQVNAAAKRLKDMAEELQRSVSRFNTGDQGTADNHA